MGAFDAIRERQTAEVWRNVLAGAGQTVATTWSFNVRLTESKDERQPTTPYAELVLSAPPNRSFRHDDAVLVVPPGSAEPATVITALVEGAYAISLRIVDVRGEPVRWPLGMYRFVVMPASQESGA